MAVPKPQKLHRCKTGHTNTAQITPCLHDLIFVRDIDYALRLLGNDIVHEKMM